MPTPIFNLLGHEGYFIFPAFWVRFEPDPSTGCLPSEMRYARWHIQPPPSAGWEGQAERLIAEMESSQQRGDLDSVSENLITLTELSSRLENHAERCRQLAQRAKSIAARHEPAAGRRASE